MVEGGTNPIERFRNPALNVVEKTEHNLPWG